MQIYENASICVEEIHEGGETDEFINIWFETREKFNEFNNKKFSVINNQFNNVYKDVKYFDLL